MKAPPPPIRTRAGLVIPGLGHLLVGEPVTGIGLMALDAVLLWAGFGLVHVGSVVYPPPGVLSVHGLIASIAWLPMVTGVWFVAFRRAFPAPYDDETFNSNRAVIVRQFQRSRTGMLGLFAVAVIIALALLTPLLAPYDPDIPSLGPELAAPSWQFPLGTDAFGRDELSRLLFGARVSLIVGFLGVAIASTIGVTVGAVAGYLGGWVDRFLMWCVDLLLSLPSLVLMMALIAVLRTRGAQSVLLMVAILGMTGWMGVSRVVRSQILSLRQQEFIIAARALGFSTARIVVVHLIPNTLAPVIVYCSLAIGSLILAEAALSYLGLGISMPMATWGNMVVDGRAQIRSNPSLVTMPALCIVAAVMSFNLLGDGLRDALDPKLRGR
jgi:peptide/nickel transport system permease protein